MKKPAHPFRLLYGILGLLSTGAGTLGIFLPVLPTTPFYLLASFLFFRSFPSFGRRLERSATWRRTAGTFLVEGGLTSRAKAAILIPVLLLLTIVFLSVESTALRITIAVLSVVKTVVFLRIRTIRKD